MAKYERKHSKSLNVSYEWLLNQLDRKIKLIASFLEIPEMDFILRSCRMKPVDYVFIIKEQRDFRTIVHKCWCDEFGNTININKKELSIIYNNVSLLDKTITTTDLYYGLHIDQIARISKAFHLISGKDDELFQDYYLLTFIGIDNYLRSYLYLFGEWQQVSPLFIGLESLKLCANSLKIKMLKNSVKEETLVVSCHEPKMWLSLLPASDLYLEDLKKEAELIYEIIK